MSRRDGLEHEVVVIVLHEVGHVVHVAALEGLGRNDVVAPDDSFLVFKPTPSVVDERVLEHGLAAAAALLGEVVHQVAETRQE